MSKPLRCQALTKNGKGPQCSRNALPNEIYCRQHLKIYQPAEEVKVEQKESKSPRNTKLKNLVNQAMQPGIIAQTLSYAGILGNISKKIKIPKKEIIKGWLLQIGVKRNLDILTSLDYKLLEGLYQTKIGNRPNVLGLQNALEKGLNPDLFSSKEFQYHRVIPELGNDFVTAFFDNDGNIIIESLKLLNLRLKEYLKNINIRVGDTIRLMQFATYRNTGVFIFDGQQLSHLNSEIDDYGSVPGFDIFNITNYPVNQYFAKTIAHNNLVVAKFENVEEIRSYPLSDDILLYQYQIITATDTWIIWSYDNNIIDKYYKLRYYESYDEELNSMFLASINSEFPGVKGTEKGTNILYDTSY